MMRSLLLLTTLACALPASAHEFFSTKVTWSREISRIFVKHCLGCHQEGGKAFSMRTFDEARPWAKAIKEEVLNRRMPPWGAVKGFGHFQNDRGLTQDEIGLIADWVEGGAPEGDKIYLPKMPAKSPAPTRALAKGREQTVVAPLVLPTAERLVAIQLSTLRQARPVQVTAVKPDGTVEPLLWLIDPERAKGNDFLFETPVSLPKGTRIEMSERIGTWRLTFAAPGRGTASVSGK
jgi:hypothetical protein